MTYITGPLEVGTGAGSEVTAGKGYAVLTQTTVLNFTAESGGGSDNVDDSSIVLPADAQILAIYVDTLTAWDSVTSAGLTIGTAAGGTQILGSSDVKSNGRETTAPTAAQLAVWDDIDATTTMHIRVAQVGNTTAGQARVTFVYAMK
jgi:hypothetical protein